MFYASARYDLAVAQIPKAGSQTMREWLLGFDVVGNDDLDGISRRVAFLRHPLERFASGYSHFYWLDYYERRHACPAPTDSYEAYVDYALEHDDEHWRPQVEHIGGAANILHRFEHLGWHWERYFPGVLPHANRTTRLPTSDYRRRDLEAFYAADLDAWERAT